MDSLLTFFLNDELDKDTIGQTVKDDFAMAKNTLNQSGHPGAFLNLIHRKADAEDSGLVNLKDMRSICQYLPLSENRGIL